MEDFCAPQMERRYIIVLVAFLCVEIISSQDTLPTLTSKNSTKVLCGQILTKELSVVCKGKYNSIKIYSKRSIRRRKLEIRVNKDAEYPFMPKTTAASLVKSRRRFKRGVVNECCDKACSYAELKTYCAQ